MVELVSKELTAGRNPLIEAREFVKQYEKFEGKSKILANACGIIEALLMEIARRDNAGETQEMGEIMPVVNPPNKALVRFRQDSRPKEAVLEQEIETEGELDIPLDKQHKREIDGLKKVIAMERGKNKKQAERLKAALEQPKAETTEEQEFDEEAQDQTEA